MIKLIIPLLLLFSCNTQSIHIQQADRVGNKFTDYLKKSEPKVSLFGRGGGFFDGDIRKISLTYQFPYKLSIDQVKEFYIYYLEDLMRMINSDEMIRPHLRNYPVTVADVDLDFIFIDSATDCFIEPPYVAGITIKNGILVVAMKNVDKGGFKSVYEQPYEEASEEMKQKNCNSD